MNTILIQAIFGFHYKEEIENSPFLCVNTSQNVVEQAKADFEIVVEIKREYETEQNQVFGI